MADSSLAEVVAARLAVHVGPHVAKMMTRSFAKKNAGGAELTAAQIPALIEEIRPMLAVLIGKVATEVVGSDLLALSAKKDR